WLQPFARYALACLGHDDFAALRAAHPGLFLAVRCRAQLALEHCRKRQTPPGELLDLLAQAARHGYRTPETVHAGQLAGVLTERSPTAARLQELVQRDATSAALRNSLRVAVEVASHRLPPTEALDLLLDWSQLATVERDEALGRGIGSQLLRLLLETASADPEVVLARACALLHEDERPALVRAWLQPEGKGLPFSDREDGGSLGRLWKAAVGLRY